jgi:hypothetical protein
MLLASANSMARESRFLMWNDLLSIWDCVKGATPFLGLAENSSHLFTRKKGEELAHQRKDFLEVGIHQAGYQTSLGLT